MSRPEGYQPNNEIKVYEVIGDYGYGFDCVVLKVCETYKEALRFVKEYREKDNRVLSLSINLERRLL
jgi:hypothetical protein